MKIVKIIATTLILCIIALFAINAPDADLRPEVKELVAIDKSLPVSNRLDENNAYFAVLGFQAAKDSDIVEIGNRIHTEYYKAIHKDTLGKAVASATGIGSALSFISAIDVPQCDPEKPGALAFYNQAEEKHSQLFKENRLLLERYDSLHRYSEYQDLMHYTPWSSLARLSSAIYSGHVLYAGQAAYLFNNGQQQKGGELIVADIRLWRKFFAGTADLAGKTFALLALTRDYTLLGEMLSSSPSDAQQVTVEPDIVTPLSKDEKSLDLVFDGYLQALYWNLVHHRWPYEQSQMTMLERYFLKINATTNNAHDIFTSLKRTSMALPAQLKGELSLLNKKIQNAQRKRLDMVYNPLGKMFLATSFDSSVATHWNKSAQLLDNKITRLKQMLN